MVKFLQRSLFLWLLALASAYATDDASIKPYQLQVTNPEQTIQYAIGDVFARIVDLTVNHPYKLALSSLPVKGSVQQGLELQKVKIEEQPAHANTRYRLQLHYQIFTSAPSVKAIKLAEHPLKITHGSKFYKVNIPEWQFQVSPLATDGEAYIEHEMSPFREPLLVKADTVKAWLGGCLGFCLLCMAGLTYINADNTWFPGMGGPFAQSYRVVSELEVHAHDHSTLQNAVLSIQRAFNKTAGENVFDTDIKRFVDRHPNFASIQAQIRSFYKDADQVLFGAAKDAEAEKITVARLAQFCAQCRHCERGVA